MKFTESVNARDTTSDESDQESIDSDYTNHNLMDSNEEDVNILSGNDVMEIPSENGTREESEDHSYQEDSVQGGGYKSDDRNVEDNISDEEDRSEEDSDDNDENEGMHANLLAEGQDDAEALREWAWNGEWMGTYPGYLLLSY